MSDEFQKVSIYACGCSILKLRLGTQLNVVLMNQDFSTPWSVQHEVQISPCTFKQISMANKTSLSIFWPRFFLFFLFERNLLRHQLHALIPMKHPALVDEVRKLLYFQPDSALKSLGSVFSIFAKAKLALTAIGSRYLQGNQGAHIIYAD